MAHLSSPNRDHWKKWPLQELNGADRKKFPISQPSLLVLLQTTFTFSVSLFLERKQSREVHILNKLNWYQNMAPPFLFPVLQIASVQLFSKSSTRSKTQSDGRQIRPWESQSTEHPRDAANTAREQEKHWCAKLFHVHIACSSSSLECTSYIQIYPFLHSKASYRCKHGSWRKTSNLALFEDLVTWPHRAQLSFAVRVTDLPQPGHLTWPFCILYLHT